MHVQEKRAALGEQPLLASIRKGVKGELNRKVHAKAAQWFLDWGSVGLAGQSCKRRAQIASIGLSSEH